MIIDIQVFEFSNTCTVGASMAVVRLTSMEALILSVTVYIDPSPQPTAGKRPCARVPTGHCLRTNGTSEWMPTRCGSRIQKGGFRTFRRGGFVQEFQERIQIVAGPWANQQAKKIADSRRGVSDHPKKNLYPRLADRQ